MPFTKKINKEDLAYLAGLIDGEGYIGLIKRFEKRRKGEPTCYYLPNVSVGMCDREAVDFLNNMFEGTFCITKKASPYRDVYQWTALSVKRVQPLLDAIIPYLKVKKKQAELLLEYIELRKPFINRGGVGRGHTTFSGLEEALYIQIKQLNHK